MTWEKYLRYTEDYTNPLTIKTKVREWENEGTFINAIKEDIEKSKKEIKNKQKGKNRIIKRSKKLLSLNRKRIKKITNIIYDRGVAISKRIKNGNITSSQLGSLYFRFLKDKVKDRELIKDIIKFRKEIMKKRISAKVYLKDNKGKEIGNFVVKGILPEEFQGRVYNRFVGTKDTASGYAEKIKKWGMNENFTVVGNPDIYGQGVLNISSVEVQYDFA